MPQDVAISQELQQCDMRVSDSRAQNLQTLWQVIEQQQPSLPPQQQVSLGHRCARVLAYPECPRAYCQDSNTSLSGCRTAAEPAARDTAQTDNIQAERTTYVKIATPLEVNLHVWLCMCSAHHERGILLSCRLQTCLWQPSQMMSVSWTCHPNAALQNTWC